MHWKYRNCLPADLEEAVKAREAQIKADREAARKQVAESRAADFIAGKINSLSPTDHYYLSAETMRAVDAREIARTLEAREAWRNGGSYSLLHSDCPVMLRVSGEDMETSRGATVPLADAKRAYLFASVLRAKGWHKNGARCAVGRYELDAINEYGVVAGCHRVSWEEADRFARSQGWIA